MTTETTDQIAQLDANVAEIRQLLSELRDELTRYFTVTTEGLQALSDANAARIGRLDEPHHFEPPTIEF